MPSLSMRPALSGSQAGRLNRLCLRPSNETAYATWQRRLGLQLLHHTHPVFDKQLVWDLRNWKHLAWGVGACDGVGFPVVGLVVAGAGVGFGVGGPS